MRFWPALIALLALTGSASAQTRQPAQITTLPTTSPQGFDILDKTGKWMPFGTASGGVFTINGAGTDVRSFGCKADGTDQTACINNALANAPDCVIIPATPLGFTVTGTLTVQRCLRGTVWNPTSSTADYSGTSRIVCNNQIAQPCLVANRTGNYTTQIENISIVGTGGIPVDGSTGFQWTGGYNLILTNVQSANFGTCAYFGPLVGAGLGPIAMHAVNANFSRCSKHYIVNDGLAELSFVGGRLGENGGGDYNSADDFFYGTKTTAGGAASGPNTFVFDGVQINPGGKTIGCAFRWGGFTDTNGVYSTNKIIGSHIEVLNGSAYTGSASRGFFCVDGTVNKLPGLQVTTSGFYEDLTKSLPFFTIDPAVPFSDDIKFVNSTLCAATLSLTIKGVVALHGPLFDSDYVCSPSTFTAGDTSAILTLANNVFPSFTVAGQWGRLSMNNNSGTLTDNATGSVFESNQLQRTWTPTLSAGAATFAYSANGGTWERTSNGGLWAYFNITLTSAAGGSGNVTITGFPKTCSGRPGAGGTQNASGFTGLTGVPWPSWIGGSPNVNILQQAAGGAGSVNVQFANLTNTTSFTGAVTCALPQ